MYKTAYIIVKNGIEQEKTYQQVIEKLKNNLTFGVGNLGKFKSNEHGQFESYYVKFTHALAALFERIDKEGWDNIKEDSWRDERITGNEKITVDYKDDVGWSITIGHSESGRKSTLHDIINLECIWDSKWSSARY